MKFKIFSIRDRGTDQFMNPMYMIQKGQAIRAFGDEINRADKDNPLYAHPEDYDLYYLGEYESNTGIFSTGTPEMTSVGKDLSIAKA